MYRSLAEALKYNTTLTSINLSDNKISNVGINALVEAKKMNRTLIFMGIGSKEIKDLLAKNKMMR